MRSRFEPNVEAGFLTSESGFGHSGERRTLRWRKVDSNPRSTCGGWRLPASAELRKVPAGQLRFAPDSPLEEAGFELPVPLAIGPFRAPKIAREL
jgi:hypothetical protein